ncbi:hypothetical protein [Pseudonocardia charpentierae]|uniref:Uncharacterized protein n=1 Tax=Pseudonocardia charpentierae TaxID=3075545 RepID=A0ABU2NFD4_9PSEU|nr:hypothetical protein [Pseudonocardia sp. DSM 45834]MDT0352168.1 hypothetical protein [Pseudonocardia sp. DSM 45834]
MTVTDDTFDVQFRDALGATDYGVGDPGMWADRLHPKRDRCEQGDGHL